MIKNIYKCLIKCISACLLVQIRSSETVINTWFFRSTYCHKPSDKCVILLSSWPAFYQISVILSSRKSTPTKCYIRDSNISKINTNSHRGYNTFVRIMSSHCWSSLSLVRMLLTFEVLHWCNHYQTTQLWTLKNRFSPDSVNSKIGGK